MSESFSLSRNKRFLVVLLALGLAAMLVTSLLEQTRHVSIQEVASTLDPGHSPEQQSDMSAMGNIGALMEQAGKNPDDPALLLRLAEALMHAQKWDAAASFAGRAIALRPNDPQPLYLLGIVEHSRGKHRESADLLEKVLALQDDPSVRYSLGMLYLHYLQEAQRGIKYLSEALHAPAASEELKADIRRELEQHAPLPPESKAPTGTEK